MFIYQRSILSMLAGALTASTLLLPACSDSTDSASPAVDDVGTEADEAVAGARPTVPIDASNPAWALGVRSFEIHPLNFRSPNERVLHVGGYARGEDVGGPWLYNVWFEINLDAIRAWGQRSQQTPGAAGAPTAQEVGSFFGRVGASSVTSYVTNDEQKAALVAGLVLAIRSRAAQSAAGPGVTPSAIAGAPLTPQARGAEWPRDSLLTPASGGAEATPFCLGENEVNDHFNALFDSIFFCAIEVFAGALIGTIFTPAAAAVWALVIPVVGAALGGVGCGNIYGLLCDEQAMYYRKDCCNGKSDTQDTFEERRVQYRLVCPLGDPVPEASACCSENTEWSGQRCEGACPDGHVRRDGQCVVPTDVYEVVVARSMVGCERNDDPSPPAERVVATNPCTGQVHSAKPGSNFKDKCAFPVNRMGLKRVKGKPAECRRPEGPVLSDPSICRFDYKASDGEIMHRANASVPCEESDGSSELFDMPIILDWWTEDLNGECVCSRDPLQTP